MVPPRGYSLYSDGRSDIFLGVVIGDLVFFRGCSSEIYFKKTVFIRVLNKNFELPWVQIF